MFYMTQKDMNQLCNGVKVCIIINTLKFAVVCWSFLSLSFPGMIVKELINVFFRRYLYTYNTLSNGYLKLSANNATNKINEVLNTYHNIIVGGFEDEIFDRLWRYYWLKN